MQHLDNLANGNDETVSCKKCNSTAFVVKHIFLNARSIQLEDNRDNSKKDSNLENNS
jgi:hypothetical protein